MVATKNPNSAQSPQSQLALLFDVKRETKAKTVKQAEAAKRPETQRTWLVRQLIAEARDRVEQEFGDVWVEGEISNCRPAASGHCYFTLKDAEAQLPVVLFRRQAILLRFKPEDGLHVRVRGKVSVYDQRGQLQLIAETLEPVGAGSLQLAFEQLRDRLKAEGLFDSERKRLLPAFPRTVAVVTSPAGAVIRDFLNVVNRRHSGLSVLVIPVAVQGESAAFEIESALALVNGSALADLIVVARGGGSLEDMAAYNSERVARAIAASVLPVVSAIGHETDFTIADFVSDLRAPTPSAAAELVTEAQHKVEELIAALTNRLIRAARFQLLQARQRMGRVPVAYSQQRVLTLMHRLDQRLDELSYRLESAMSATLREQRQSTAALCAAVLRHDPRQRLLAANAALINWQVRANQSLDRDLKRRRHANQSLEARLHRAMQVQLAGRRAVYTSIRGQMQSLSPLAVLQRGYALVEDESGALVRSVGRLSAEQQVTTRLGDGTFQSRVLTIEKQAELKPARKKKDKSINS